MTKIALYAIAKNEIKHIERWYESAKEADAVFVCDTGSTDGSIAAFAGLDVHLSEAGFHPFRFDSARNFSLLRISGEYDWCVFLDLDETLEAGWANKLRYYIETYPEATSFNFKMIYEQTPDGRPTVVYNRQMAHTRNYVWKYPVHELLIPTQDSVLMDADIAVYHKPDTTKSRSQYLDLLERAAVEHASDPRCIQYLGREYMYRGYYSKAILKLTEHLRIEPNPVLRSESSSYIASCYDSLDDLGSAEVWHLKAIAEASQHREPWGHAAMFYRNCNEHESAIGMIRGMLRVEAVPSDAVIWRSDFYAEWPHHLAAVCYHNLGYRDKAILSIEKAYSVAPTNPRVLADYATITRRCPPNIHIRGLNNDTDRSSVDG